MDSMMMEATDGRVWTVERPRHRAAHDCHAKSGTAQRHASSRRVPFEHEGVPALPAGCARGEPVVTGVPSVALPAGGKELFNVLMSFVERDDYYAVLELARRAGDAIGFTRKCGFTVALRPEGNSIVASFPEQLCVCEANLLHYAICISSFRAAIALLVVCPAMLHARCKVIATNPATQKEVEEFWGASELARIFCLLYDERGNSDVSATAAVYNQALPLLEIGEQDLNNLPFLTLPSKMQRIQAAGCDAQATVDIFVAAARDYSHSAQQQ